jgi:1,4-dihydroxy-2-naphthoate octaprenyltransferase
MILDRSAAFLHLSRPHFLVFSTLPYLLGLLVAWREGAPLDARIAWVGLAAQLLVQLSTAYVNDYYDLPSDRLNRRRTLLSGGSGELARGVLPPRAALIAAAVCLGGAVGLGLVLTAWGMRPVSWAVLIAAMLAAVFYTAPPLRLCWRGWGEFAAATGAALVVPQWAYSLQPGVLGADLVRRGLPVLPLIAGMLLGIATPDLPADLQAGKRTWRCAPGRDGSRACTSAGDCRDGLALLLLGQVGALIALAGLPVAAAAGLCLRRHADWRGPRLLLMVVWTALVPAVALVFLAGAVLGGAV